MADNTQSGMPCSEFDALLMEAVEGKLATEQMERFRSHADSCGVCGPLFADAQSGFSWLHSLTPVEPPANLVHNILAATSERDLATKKAAAEKPGLVERLRMGARAAFTPLMQPRLAGTLAMGFFSISLLLNVTGIRVSDIAKIDLRPSAIKKTYYMTSAKVTKYYENLRVVYEFESKVREIKEAVPVKEEERKKEESKPDQKQNQKRDENMSNRPTSNERDNARRYQQESAEMTTVSYHPNMQHLSLKRATSCRAIRNDRRTA